jgi:hypothetical protein
MDVAMTSSGAWGVSGCMSLNSLADVHELETASTSFAEAKFTISKAAALSVQFAVNGA